MSLILLLCSSYTICACSREIGDTVMFFCVYELLPTFLILLFALAFVYICSTLTSLPISALPDRSKNFNESVCGSTKRKASTVLRPNWLLDIFNEDIEVFKTSVLTRTSPPFSSGMTFCETSRCYNDLFTLSALASAQAPSLPIILSVKISFCKAQDGCFSTTDIPFEIASSLMQLCERFKTCNVELDNKPADIARTC